MPVTRQPPLAPSDGADKTRSQCMSLARIFQRPHYRSEATRFIDELKQARPELEQQQRQGRALLWDKQIDRDLQAELRAGRVRQQAYVYQTKPSL